MYVRATARPTGGQIGVTECPAVVGARTNSESPQATSPTSPFSTTVPISSFRAYQERAAAVREESGTCLRRLSAETGQFKRDPGKVFAPNCVSMGWIHDRALTLVLMAMFLLFLAGQFVAGLKEYNSSQVEHDQPPVA